MDTSTEEEAFDRLVPFGEAAFVVLRAQLIAEYSLTKYVAARVPTLAKELDDRNNEVRSGIALILLAQALSLRDEIPPTCSDILWPALKALNALRNDLAHQLYPNTDKIDHRMREFVRIVSGETVSRGENLNQLFRLAARTVVGYLAIDRTPLTIADTV